MARKANEKRGITLVALAIIIVILLILVGITVIILFSKGGIFNKAQDTSNTLNEVTMNNQTSLENVSEPIENSANGQVDGETVSGGIIEKWNGPKKPTTPTFVLLVVVVTTFMVLAIQLLTATPTIQTTTFLTSPPGPHFTLCSTDHC